MNPTIAQLILFIGTLALVAVVAFVLGHQRGFEKCERGKPIDTPIRFSTLSTIPPPTPFILDGTQRGRTDIPRPDPDTDGVLFLDGIGKESWENATDAERLEWIKNNWLTYSYLP